MSWNSDDGWSTNMDEAIFLLKKKVPAQPKAPEHPAKASCLRGGLAIVRQRRLGNPVGNQKKAPLVNGPFKAKNAKMAVQQKIG